MVMRNVSNAVTRVDPASLLLLVRSGHDVGVTGSGVIQQRPEARGRVLSRSECSQIGRPMATERSPSWRPRTRCRTCGMAQRRDLPDLDHSDTLLWSSASGALGFFRGLAEEVPAGSEAGLCGAEHGA